MLSRFKLNNHPLLITKENLVLLFLELCLRVMNKKKETFCWVIWELCWQFYMYCRPVCSIFIIHRTIRDSPMWTTLIGLPCPFCGEFHRHIKTKRKQSQGVVLWPLQYYSLKLLFPLPLQLFPSGSEVASFLSAFAFRIIMVLPFLAKTFALFLIFFLHPGSIFVNSPLLSCFWILPLLG